jgi:hypothetical protein
MSRDYSKYNVEGLASHLNKRDLVLTVVKDWANKNNPSLEDLQRTFPKEIQGSHGIIELAHEAKDSKRFNLKEVIETSDGIEVVVSNQWGDNIVDFLKCARSLGYNISLVSDKESLAIENVTNETKNRVNINISGRVFNYMFGILNNDYFEECETAMGFVSEDIETTQDLLKLFYDTVLEGASDGLEAFKDQMDMELLEKNCPLLSSFIELAQSGEIGHLQFYETFFDMAWKDEVNFFEADALITISVDGKEIVAQQTLGTFIGETEFVDSDDHPEAAAQVKAFWDKHFDKLNFGEGMGVDEFTAYRADNGVIQLNEWIEPKGLTPYRVQERNVTFEHDNIADFDFNFNTDGFDLSKLIFVMFANATSFNQSGSDYIGSFLSYDNTLIRPETNIHRDKGFSLYYEDDHYSCDYLIVG